MLQGVATLSCIQCAREGVGFAAVIDRGAFFADIGEIDDDLEAT